MLNNLTTPSLLNPTRYLIIVVIVALFGGLLLNGCDTVESDIASTSEETLHLSASLVSSGPSCSSGVQPSGALYEICTPEAGIKPTTLAVYAHGFLFPQLPLQIPEQEGGIDIRDFIADRGYGYAATSYYTNGVIDPDKGAEDLRDLIVRYSQQYGRPERVLLVSFSNGTLLSVLTLEDSVHLFDGALASCGPHGSYAEEINYLGDVYVLFDFLFQDVDIIPGFGPGLPGGPDGVPLTLLNALSAMAPYGYTAVDVLAQSILSALQNNPAKTQQLLGAIQFTSTMSRGNVLFANASEGVELVIRAVAYNVFATNDALEKLDGRFFDNTSRIYADLLPNETIRHAVNSGVQRYEADRHVTAALEHRYQSKGHLRTPVVSLHNTRDPLIPFWQQSLYLEALDDRSSNYTVVPVEGYGHCNFMPDDVADGLDLLGEKVASIAASSF